MDVIVAARLSQRVDGQTGIDTQDEDCAREAREQGHNVIAVVADHKSGAADWMSRRNLRPWLTEPERLILYQGIYAASQDRLSRGKWRDEIAIRMWAEDNRKELFIVDTKLHWPPRDAVEQLRWEMDASRARQEWGKASRRYRRMQSWLRDNDYLVGRAPYGYRVIGAECGESPCKCKKDHKTLAPDPVTSEVVKRMVAKYLGGNSRRTVAIYLDAHGFPSPNGVEWTGKTIAKILRSETLIGKRRDASGKVVLRFEPILDLETWRTLQAAIDANTYRRGRVNGKGLLCGVAHCGLCGRRLHLHNAKTRNKGGSIYNWSGYRCNGDLKHPATCGTMIRAAGLETWVDQRMRTLTDVERVEETLIHGEDPREELDRLRDEADALDPFNPADDARRAELREQAEEISLRDKPKDELRRVFTGISMADHWAALDPQERRAMLLEDGVKVYAVKDGRGAEIRAWMEAESEAYVTLIRQVSPAELRAAEAAIREATRRPGVNAVP